MVRAVTRLDGDSQGIKEFCGRCAAVPLVKLAEETYSPPDFPPKLEWYKFKSQRDCTGSVLAAFELIEVSGGDTNRYSRGASYTVSPRFRSLLPRINFERQMSLECTKCNRCLQYMYTHVARKVLQCLDVQWQSKIHG